MLHAVKRDPAGKSKLCRPLLKGLPPSAIANNVILDGNACIHTGTDSIQRPFNPFFLAQPRHSDDMDLIARIGDGVLGGQSPDLVKAMKI